MGCETVRDLFSEYYDGVSEVALDIERHMESCAECRREYENFAALFASIAHFREPDVSEEFHASLVSYVDGYIKSRKHFMRRSWRSVRVGLGAVAAAAAAILLFVWQTVPTSYEIQVMPHMVELPMPAYAPFQMQDVEDGVAVGGFGAFLDEDYYFGDDWIVFRDAADFSGETFFGDDSPLPHASFILPTDDEYLQQEAEESLQVGDDRLMGRGAEDMPFSNEETFVLDDDALPRMVVGADEFMDFAARPRTAFDELFEPAAVVVTETVVVRPHLLTAAVLFVVGFFLGYRVKRLVKYIERKINNAP